MLLAAKQKATKAITACKSRSCLSMLLLKKSGASTNRFFIHCAGLSKVIISFIVIVKMINRPYEGLKMHKHCPYNFQK